MIFSCRCRRGNKPLLGTLYQPLLVGEKVRNGSSRGANFRNCPWDMSHFRWADALLHELLEGGAVLATGAAPATQEIHHVRGSAIGRERIVRHGFHVRRHDPHFRHRPAAGAADAGADAARRPRVARAVAERRQFVPVEEGGAVRPSAPYVEVDYPRAIAHVEVHVHDVPAHQTPREPVPNVRFEEREYGDGIRVGWARVYYRSDVVFVVFVVVVVVGRDGGLLQVRVIFARMTLGYGHCRVSFVFYFFCTRMVGGSINWGERIKARLNLGERGRDSPNSPS